MRKFWAGLVIAAGLVVETAYLIFANFNQSSTSEQISTMAFFLFPMVGAILLARHPRNPVGYLVTVLGLSVLTASTLFEYSMMGYLSGPNSLPFAGVAGWLSLQMWSLTMPCLVFMLLIFPNGRLIHPRWKWLVYYVLAITIPILVYSAIYTWPSRDKLALMDLQRIPFSENVALVFRVYEVWNLLMIAAVILAFFNFTLRFLRSRGIERQQLKWFVFGMSTIPMTMVIDEMMRWVDQPLLYNFNYVLNVISIAAFPLVMLISITRYRLYDIDFIIRRTLLYSALTLTLAAVYFGAVLVMQSIFTRGLGAQSEIWIVLSTLLIAALFQPLRRQFQAVIDKRFYRSKYDAEKTLASFASRLQNEVDLEAIQGYLVRAVEENIQPEGASLWLVKKN